MNINDILENNYVDLEFKSNKSKMVGKGSILLDKGKIIVVTAAHCIFDFYSNCFYKDLYIKHKNEFFKVKSSFIHKDWVNKGVLDYDTGFLILENSEKIKNLVPVTPIFNVLQNQEYIIFAKKKRILKSSGNTILQRRSFDDYLYGSSLKGIAEKTDIGDSGGPWFIKFSGKIYQNSNTSLSFKNSKKVTWGTHWGNEIKMIYKSIFGDKNDDTIKVDY